MDDLGTQGTEALAGPREREAREARERRLARPKRDGRKEDAVELGQELAAFRDFEGALESAEMLALERPGNLGQIRVESAHLRRREEVHGPRREPAVREVVEERVVLDGNARTVIDETRRGGRIDVGDGERGDAARAGRLDEVLSGDRGLGGRDLGRFELFLGVALLEVEGIDARAAMGSVRSIARAALRSAGTDREAGGGDGREERALVDAAGELHEEARVVGEEDEARLPADDGVDELERVGAVELRPGLARIATEVAGADDAAQMPPALRVRGERDDATGEAVGVGDLGADDGVDVGELGGAAREVDGAAERVDVGERQAGEAEGAGALEERAGRVDAGEHGVVTVDAQGDVHGGAGRTMAGGVGPTSGLRTRPRRGSANPPGPRGPPRGGWRCGDARVVGAAAWETKLP